MNGPHDLGGRHGFGPVVPEEETTIFHAEWEKRVLGLTIASASLGYWNIDASRHARESLPHPIYLGTSYYEIWLRALENLLERMGEVAEDERLNGKAASPGNRSDRKLEPEAVSTVLQAGGPANRKGPAPAFAVGDTVRTRNHQPASHTRLPAYARDKTGMIVASHGAHVFPDTNAHFEGEAPCPLYTVEFTATELYGSDADPTLTVTIDAWERYLERA